MDNLDIYSLINKALKYYDNQKVKFKNYQNMKETVNREEQTIKFGDKTFSYEALGIFDNTTRIWLWSWMDPTLMSKETILSKQLLNYGLKQNPDKFDKTLLDTKIFLKTQLVNSRFIIDTLFQLEIHLALASYLVKDNIKFIFYQTKFLDKEKKKYIQVYYFVK